MNEQQGEIKYTKYKERVMEYREGAGSRTHYSFGSLKALNTQWAFNIQKRVIRGLTVISKGGRASQERAMVGMKILW